MELRISRSATAPGPSVVVAAAAAAVVGSTICYGFDAAAAIGSGRR